MNDYSDLIFLMGAMILFSLLTLNVSRNIVMNSQNLSESEVEYEAIALAQGLIEEALWTTSEEQLQPGHTEYIFKDSELEDKEAGYQFEYDISVEVDDSYDISGSDTINKKIIVRVNSQYLDNPVTLEFIKSYKS